MIQILFILTTALAAGPPAEPVCIPYLQNPAVDAYANALRSEDPHEVRRGLHGLVALPLDHHAALHSFWWPRALTLAVSSREHGPLAALAFLRFHDVDTWGDVRTSADFAHLPPDRQERFLTDLKAALKEVPYRIVASIDAVDRIGEYEWKVKGSLKYTREVAATFFGTPVHLDDWPEGIDGLKITFTGPNVNRAPHTITVAAKDGFDLAYVAFEVSYHPGRESRGPITVTTVLNHRVAGRIHLAVPESKQP